MKHLFLSLCVLLAFGCSSKKKGAEAAVDLTPAPIGAAECAACGMVVKEQPSPRGQLIHRDGHRAHFCSIGDMITYHNAPSQHGRPAAVFVEVQPADTKAAVLDKTERPFVAAEKAHYVQGFKRDGIMGKPVLSFANPAEAAAAAQREGGAVATWSLLVGTTK